MKIKNLNILNMVPGVVYAQEKSILPDKSRSTPTPTPTPVFEDRSSNIRLNVEWPRALRAFNKNPLLGTGYSSITLATDNDYLRLLGETGLLGFLSFILVIGRLIVLFISRIPFQKYLSGIDVVYVAAMFGSIPGIMLNAVFIDVFEASKFAVVFWLTMGFAVAILVPRSENAHENIKFKKR